MELIETKKYINYNKQTNINKLLQHLLAKNKIKKTKTKQNKQTNEQASKTHTTA